MSEGPHLIRLSRILELRDAQLEPVLEAVTISGTSNVMFGVSALTRRMALKLPYHPEALKAVAPDVASEAAEPRALLEVVVDGANLGAAMTIPGSTTARAAVDDISAPAARAHWGQVVERLSSGAGATISNRTRFLTEERAAVRLKVPARVDDAETRFTRELHEILTGLGIPDAHRTAWTNAYRVASHGAAVAIRTECILTGPDPRLSFMFGTKSWDLAIEMVMAIADKVSAREAAASFGILAGELGIEPRGVEVVLDAHASPDLMVWAYLRRD